MNSKLREVLSRIESSAKRVGRDPQEIQLVAVSKTKSVEEMNGVGSELLASGRGVLFGENYLQEFKKKSSALAVSYDAHFIGHLQRNKAKDAVKLFSCIQTVDSAELLVTLHKEAEKLGKKIKILFQVNISSDEEKSGVSKEELISLIDSFFALSPASHLEWCGLMTITKLYSEAEEARKDFRSLRELSTTLLQKNERVRAYFKGRTFELSMGMSSDFEVAIEEGATIVRVGSAIFGARN